MLPAQHGIATRYPPAVTQLPTAAWNTYRFRARRKPSRDEDGLVIFIPELSVER
jgi:hypothetical protein